ncbi:MAG TPA: MFS transporter [Dehalococcoidia bacterium]|jgi:MFS family permease|nr:MFS transporter [Dehalococcoidia bacterium]
MAIAPQDVGLLANPRFRRLLEARVLGQTAQNAMMYALLILVVEDTGSSVQSVILIAAFTLPGIVLSLPAGAAADIIPKRLTLTLGYLLRAVIVGALVYYRDDLGYVYLLAAASSVVLQFFSPAEAAAMPSLVRREQLTAANSWMLFSLVLGQIAGMVIIAPLLLKALDAQAVFVTCTILFLAATYVIGWMASGFSEIRDERPAALGFVEATREGFRILRNNRRAYLSTIYLTTAIALSRVLVVLLPKYTENVLNIKAEDTAFIAAPAAMGAGIGLLLAPPLTRLVGAWRIVAFGFGLFLLGLIALGLAVYVQDALRGRFDLGTIDLGEETFGVSGSITITMLLAIPLGFAFTLVSVASRVVMNQQAPPEAQGRVYAAQMALGDLASLPPLLLVGIIADSVGVRATLLAASFTAAAGALYLTFSRRPGAPADSAD